MIAGAMQNDRRQNRSTDPALALQLYLEAEAARVGARAMAVGTLDGLPIASCGAVDPLLLSVVGSVQAQGGSPAAIDPQLGDLRAVVVRLADAAVVLSCCGAVPCPNAAAGVQRILA